MNSPIAPATHHTLKPYIRLAIQVACLLTTPNLYTQATHPLVQTLPTSSNTISTLQEQPTNSPYHHLSTQDIESVDNHSLEQGYNQIHNHYQTLTQPLSTTKQIFIVLATFTLTACLIYNAYKPDGLVIRNFWNLWGLLNAHPPQQDSSTTIIDKLFTRPLILTILMTGIAGMSGGHITMFLSFLIVSHKYNIYYRNTLLPALLTIIAYLIWTINYHIKLRSISALKEAFEHWRHTKETYQKNTWACEQALAIYRNILGDYNQAKKNWANLHEQSLQTIQKNLEEERQQQKIRLQQLKTSPRGQVIKELDNKLAQLNKIKRKNKRIWQIEKTLYDTTNKQAKKDFRHNLQTFIKHTLEQLQQQQKGWQQTKKTSIGAIMQEIQRILEEKETKYQQDKNMSAHEIITIMTMYYEVQTKRLKQQESELKKKRAKLEEDMMHDTRTSLHQQQHSIVLDRQKATIQDIHNLQIQEKKRQWKQQKIKKLDRQLQQNNKAQQQANNNWQEVKRKPKKIFLKKLTTRWHKEQAIWKAYKQLPIKQIIQTIDDYYHQAITKWKEQKNQLLKNNKQTIDLLGRAIYKELQNMEKQEIKAKERWEQVLKNYDQATKQYERLNKTYQALKHKSTHLIIEELTKQIEVKSAKQIKKQAHNNLQQLQQLPQIAKTQYQEAKQNMITSHNQYLASKQKCQDLYTQWKQAPPSTP